jgi:hypothetical protein
MRYICLDHQLNLGLGAEGGEKGRTVAIMSWDVG